MPNFVMLDHVIGVIEANPEQHNQGSWATQDECGTTMCLAGWTAKIAGATILFEHGRDWSATCITPQGERETIPDFAAEVLGLDEREADRLFYTARDLDDIKMIVKEFANSA